MFLYTSDLCQKGLHERKGNEENESGQALCQCLISRITLVTMSK